VQQTTNETALRIQALAKLHGTSEVASKLGASTRTIERWSRGEVRIPNHLEPALDMRFGAPIGRSIGGSNKLTFIDLFAGIGGIRLGIEKAGADCVFTSEWDKFAVKTYAENHDSTHEIVGDIRSVDAAHVPDHSILAAGFPCQPFSLAGVSKKNSLGRQHGFLDPTQGTLFFNVAEIIAEKRPRAFLLENVKNLVSHDRGNTFRVMQQILAEELGYTLFHKVIDAKGYVPQHRERIMIVGLRDGGTFDWSNVKPSAVGGTMESVLHIEDGSEREHDAYVDPASGKVHEKYVLSDKLWAYLQGYAAKHKAAGNGFGYGIVDRASTSRTLSARYYKDGSEILVSRGIGANPRRLTPRECARLMGYEDTFRIPVSDTQAYKQFGNSVAVPVIEAVARELVSALQRAPEIESPSPSAYK
jgi:DNA (cytosine-5)-methyltransferase 1